MENLTKIRQATARASYLLEVDDIKVVYHNLIRVLTGVTLRIPEGEIVTLLGNNGAGKTTVLRAIGNQLGIYNGRITDGQIHFRGEPIHTRASRAHKLAKLGLVHVPEGRHIFKHMTVEENIRVGMFARLGRDLKPASELQKMYDLFTPLSKLRKKQAGYLSGGEQQMLAIARALVASPRLLMLDEPSLGLAPIFAKHVFEIIRRINRELKTTIFLVEQNARAALELASFGYILDLGQVVLSGPTAELKDNPDVRDFYLGLSAAGQRKSFAEIKSYRRRRRWL